ncbi:uncharacterized protein LOC126816612 [Patella vulgata]|uniref:uncharacterized protein LOC126816612 n=1 Tax=Patella vulgata TaxID=6465 RepID=UPI0024A7DC06|nr:uncharacterized protein LOC126816612 [Patella vulgata]
MMVVILFLLLGLSFTVADRSIDIRNIPIYDMDVDGGRVKRDVESMLVNLVFEVETESDRGVLRLTQIDRLPTFSISNGVTDEIFGTTRNRAVYTDLSRKASIMVERRFDLEDNIIYKLSGNFELEERMVYIKPVEEDGGDSGQTVQHVIHYEELMIDHGGDYNDRKRKKRSTTFRKYIIEVCFISDTKDFEYYLERNNNDSNQAIDEMSVYYALVNEQLRLRYHSVYDTNGSIDILIKATGLFLLQDRLNSNFTVGLAKANDTQVESPDGLGACRDWLTDIPSNITLPTSDHYMFFTGYDLVRGNQTSFAGLAGLRVMCTPNSVSINENSRNGIVGSIIAHELGHAIGSKHDRQIGCSDEDGYIMTTSIPVAQNTEEALRLWQFSNCSVAIFKEALDEADCVYNDPK